MYIFHSTVSCLEILAAFVYYIYKERERAREIEIESMRMNCVFCARCFHKLNVQYLSRKLRNYAYFNQTNKIFAVEIEWKHMPYTIHIREIETYQQTNKPIDRQTD